MEAKYWKRPTDVELRELYVDQRLSIRAIIKLTGAGSPTVRSWMKKAGIHSRTISEAKQGQGPTPEAIRASVTARRKHFITGKDMVGYKIDGDGYVKIWNTEKQDYEREHRIVLEKKLGRPLLPTEDAHHINGVRADNRPENLAVKDSRGEHQATHAPFRCRRENGTFASDGGGQPKVGRSRCKVVGCGRPNKGHGLCLAHLGWSKAHGGETPTYLVGTGRHHPRPNRKPMRKEVCPACGKMLSVSLAGRPRSHQCR
jgi:hypothetical protein